jgi:hypothetical protein
MRRKVSVRRSRRGRAIGKPARVRALEVEVEIEVEVEVEGVSRVIVAVLPAPLASQAGVARRI